MVFSDVNLQGEDTGHGLSRWLDQHHPEVCLILTSGNANAAAALPRGARRAFISKPYVLADVDQRIKDMLPRDE
jgi:hypothetical protein